MNAPATSVMLDPVVELIPITAIRPSRTAIQALRRARFDADALVELAANISKIGVAQPVLVRPVPPDGTVKFELVAGERRWLAADRAGLAHIPAAIRDLTDAEALELQISENVQRQSYHPLEEAEGFHELMQAKGITAEQLGDIIGKSRSYVYARTKLRDLCPEAREALAAGTLDASKALLLARLPGEKLQRHALKLVGNTEYYSFRRFFEQLRDKFMAKLDGAPFSLEDDTFFYMQKVAGKRGEEECIAIPACVKCPHFSGNDRELQDALGSDANICTDRPCFDGKAKMFWQRKRGEAEAAGKTVITGEEAAKIIPGKYESVKNGYVNVDDECDEIQFHEPQPEATGDEDADEAALNAWYEREEQWRPPSYRQALGDALPQTVLAQDKSGELVELVPVKDLTKALKDKGIEPHQFKYRVGNTLDDTPQQSPEERAAEQAKAELARTIELTYRQHLLGAIFAKWKGPLKRPDLLRLARELLDHCYGEASSLLEDLHGGAIDIDKLKDDELVRLMILCIIVDDATSVHGKPGDLLELAQRLKIDAKKIRADVTAELKPKPAPKADAPQPKPAAKAKKKAAKK